MPWQRSLCHGTAVAVCLLLSSGVLKPQTPLLPETTPLSALAGDVANLNRAVRQRTPLQQVHLRKRAEILSRLMERDPAQSVRVALPADQAADLAAQFPMEPVEQFSTWEGAVQTLVVDDFEHNRTRRIYILRSGDDSIELHGAVPMPDFPCGAKARITGMRLRDHVAVTGVDVQAAGTNDAIACTTTGVQNVAVLLVSFPSTANTTTVAQAQAAFFGSGRSLTNFWQEASYGKTSASGSVLGPFTLDADYPCTQNDQILSAAIRAADPIVDFRNYTRIFVVMPNNGGCAVGLGSVGCNSYSSVKDGAFTASASWIITDSATTQDKFVSLVSHEGGHNLGLDHSSTLDYGNIPLGPNAPAGFFDEYGNFYSMMGLSLTYGTTQILGHYTAPQKQKLGWFSAANVQNVTQNGSYVLNALEPASTGPQALRVRRGTSGSQSLWIEYRPGLGNYDNSYFALPSNVRNGVLVYLEDPADPQTAKPELLDFQPVSTPNAFYNAALGAGNVWRDPYSDLTLTLAQISPSQATLSVTYANACAVISPNTISLTSFAQTASTAITAASTCAWTATTATPWITLGSPSSGFGNGTLNFSVSNNPTTSSRTGTISVGGQTVTISQAGLSCSYTLNFTDLTASVAGTTASDGVTAPAGCSWTALSDSAWITVTAGSSGTGTGTVSFSVGANNTQSARSGRITIGSQILTISQPAAAGCSYALSSTSLSAPGSGGSAQVNITAGAGCTWTAVSNSAWITITSGTSGSGNGSVSFTFAANNGADRNGSITIAGQVVAISQSAAPFAAALPSGLLFIPVSPCRLVDTRAGQGKAFPFGPPTLVATSLRDIPVLSAGCGIPAQAQAYSLNITVVPQEPLSYLTVWPSGQAQPFVSTLNAPNGQVVANAAIVPAGLNGEVSLYVTNATDVIIDISGYFTNAPASGATALLFHPIAPCRVMDTRAGQGTAGAFGPPSLLASGTRTVPVPEGRCGVPASAQAYSVNATVVPQGPLAFLTLWPAGQPKPLVSTLNAPQGQVIANAAIVPSGAAGGINVFASNATDVILDLNGYFDSVSPGLLFNPVIPCRPVDTRAGQGTSGAFGPPSLLASGSRDMPIPLSRCSVPATAKAYSVNATVLPTGALSFLTLWPSAQTQPFVSTLNAGSGGVAANAAIVPAGANGGISAFASNATDLILDISGYFAP